MPNKHFCQGPTCHEQQTQDRFLKSRGVVRGRYAYAEGTDNLIIGVGLHMVQMFIFVVNDVSLIGYH